MSRTQMQHLFSLAKQMTIGQQEYFAKFLEEEVKIKKGWSKMTGVVIERLAEQALSN